MEIITKSSQQTQNLGEKIGLDLKPGTVIALSGDLGSGKTTFLKGLAKGLGIKKRIVSPTFVFVKQYFVGKVNFYHADLYRIENPKDTQGLGLKELFEDHNGITAVEWAEKFPEIFPKEAIKMNFTYLNDKERKIVINNYNNQ